MRKGEIINGYKILEDFKVAGGMSKVSFAEKEGKTYFIKEFLAPKYPTIDSPGSEKTKEKKRRACDEFEKHHKDLNNAIGKCCAGSGGNLIYAIDFFRNGTSYYKITEKIDICSFPSKNIAKLPIKKIIMIAKSAAHSIKILHGQKIVHGDLKPDNLPIKEVSRGYVVKLIDFDDSYFEGNPPSERESLVGTPEYYSPEQAAYIMDEDEVLNGNTLTCKSDIFTLGIIFSEYFSGEKPIFEKGNISTWSCVNDGKSFSFKKEIHPEIDSLIRRMLSKNPADRPSINEVLITLKDIEKKIEDDPPPPIGSGKGPTLIFGPGFEKLSKGGTTKKGTKGKGDVIEDDTKKVNRLRGAGLAIADK